MKFLFSIIIMGFLSGCASALSGGKQTVTVVTPNIEGASCSLSDSKGRVWYVEETPGTALVKKGDGPISIICEKTGFLKGTALLDEEVAPSSYSNLLLGPAAPIGYALDGMSGSIQRYKSSVEVMMEENPAKKPWETTYDYENKVDSKK